MFKIGDVVKIKNKEQKYIIIEDNVSMENTVFFISMDDYDFERLDYFGSRIYNSSIDKLDKVGRVKTFKCARCGETHIGKPIISENGKYCYNCSTIMDYETENNLGVHKSKQHGKTYGFELECIPKSKADRLFLCHRKYNLIPTSDCSLDCGGVEYKTPIYYSLNGLKSMLYTFEKHVDFKNESCGQHINIGHVSKINYNSMQNIRKYSLLIFNPVADYMFINPESTKKICGRFFNHYACYNSCDEYERKYNRHHSWINLSHVDRFEFRLAKIQTPDQYIQLVNMYGEWVDAIITWFLRGPNERNAQIAGRKLLNIFQKYERGDAVSQSKARNNRKAS